MSPMISQYLLITWLFLGGTTSAGDDVLSLSLHNEYITLQL